jgi:hypothetical protein
MPTQTLLRTERPPSDSKRSNGRDARQIASPGGKQRPSQVYSRGFPSNFRRAVPGSGTLRGIRRRNASLATRSGSVGRVERRWNYGEDADFRSETRPRIRSEPTMSTATWT